MKNGVTIGVAVVLVILVVSGWWYYFESNSESNGLDFSVSSGESVLTGRQLGVEIATATENNVFTKVKMNPFEDE